MNECSGDWSPEPEHAYPGCLIGRHPRLLVSASDRAGNSRVAGTWIYFCEVHPALMAGATVTVQ